MPINAAKAGSRPSPPRQAVPKPNRAALEKASMLFGPGAQFSAKQAGMKSAQAIMKIPE